MLAKIALRIAVGVVLAAWSASLLWVAAIAEESGLGPSGGEARRLDVLGIAAILGIVQVALFTLIQWISSDIEAWLANRPIAAPLPPSQLEPDDLDDADSCPENPATLPLTSHADAWAGEPDPEYPETSGY